MSKLREELIAMGVPQAKDSEDVEALAINVFRAMGIAYLEVCEMFEQQMGVEIPGKDPLVAYAKGVKASVGKHNGPVIEDRRDTVADSARRAIYEKELRQRQQGMNRAQRRRMR